MDLRKCFVVLCLAAAAASAQAPRRESTSPVVMTVDGKDVTAADVQKILELGQPDFLKQYQTNPQGALMNWYVMLQLGREGERLKLDQASPLKEQFETIKSNLLASAMLNYELNSYPVSAEMVETYFNAHHAQYEQAHFKAIYIRFKPAENRSPGTSAEAMQRAAQEALAATLTERSEADAAALAAEIVKQLRAGADFSKLVETYSEDKISQAKGGDFGVVKIGGTYPEDFRKSIMALEKGAIGDPIRQPTGYYIVRVEEKGVAPIDQVRTEITETSRQQHLTQWMQDMNARFNPVIKDPSFFAPKQQPTPFSVTGRP